MGDAVCLESNQLAEISGSCVKTLKQREDSSGKCFRINYWKKDNAGMILALREEPFVYASEILAIVS